MNEILKFKLGRKIRKAQDGTKTYYEVTGRPKITVTKGGEESLGTYNRRIYNGKWTWGLYDGEGNFTPITKQVTLNNGTILNTNGSKSSVGARNAVKNAKVIERGYMDANGNKTPLDAAPLNTGGNVGGKPVVRRTGINWGNEFTNFMGGLSQEQQDWLKQNGLDNAQALQTYLDANNYYEGGSNSRNIDNKFGRNSKAAWNKFVASGIMGKNRDQEILAEKQQPVIDAPDPFGYKTDNHYGDGSALKNMGFNNYAGLQKFAAGDDQFARDLRERFGQDISKWDQAAVEGALGVSGRYRGSRGGDFGDMARSMQQWAAQQNAAYDQKELASRTGKNGTVYSSPEMMRKFESIKVQPEIKWGLTPKTKFDFSNLKYNTDFGGASTLGDAGLGTLSTSQKQLAYADK